MFLAHTHTRTRQQLGLAWAVVCQLCLHVILACSLLRQQRALENIKRPRSEKGLDAYRFILHSCHHWTTIFLLLLCLLFSVLFGLWSFVFVYLSFPLAVAAGSSSSCFFATQKPTTLCSVRDSRTHTGQCLLPTGVGPSSVGPQLSGCDPTSYLCYLKL